MDALDELQNEEEDKQNPRTEYKDKYVWPPAEAYEMQESSNEEDDSF